MRNLLDIVLALDAEDRRALSTIIIERSRDGGWQARCSICRDQYAEGAAVERIANQEIGADIPPGIGMMAWVRVPDQEYPLDLDEIERDRSLRAQASALQASGLVGQLDMARFDRADQATSYVLKTHAGSQRERTQWLLSLRERPENTIYLQ